MKYKRITNPSNTKSGKILKRDMSFMELSVALQEAEESIKRLENKNKKSMKVIYELL